MKRTRWAVLAAMAVLVAGVAVPANAAVSIAVNSSAALQGSFGMQVTFNNTTGDAYVQDNSPNNEAVYYASFRLRNDNVSGPMTLNSLKSVNIMNGYVDEPAGTVKSFRVQLINTTVNTGNPEMAIQAFPGIDSPVGGFGPRAATFVKAGSHQYTVEVRTAASGVSADGLIKIYRDAVLRNTKSGLQNFTAKTNMVRLGGLGGNNSQFANGLLDLDDFVSTRTAQF